MDFLGNVVELFLVFVSLILIVSLIYFFFYCVFDVHVQEESALWFIGLFLFPAFGLLMYYSLKISPRRKHSKNYLIKCLECRKYAVINEEERLNGSYICPECSELNNFTPDKRLRKENLQT